MRFFRTGLFGLSFIFLPAAFTFGQNWKPLNPPLNTFDGFIYSSVTDSAGNVYAAGNFTGGTGSQIVAKWDGISWTKVGSYTSSIYANNPIITMTMDWRGNLYAAGGFVDSSGFSCVAKWNGSVWSEVGTGTAGLNTDGIIYAVVADKAGNLYAAGNFTNSSGKCYVAKWDGNTWSELGSSTNALNANNAIFSLTIDSAGNLYAGGYFTNSAGKEYVAEWNGSTWKETGTGSAGLNANDFIQCLATDNEGNIYAGGDFRNDSNLFYVARWNGTSWSEIGSGTGALNADNGIKTIVVKNTNEVYVAGFFYGVWKWNGITWSEVNSQIDPLLQNGTVNTLSLDNSGHIFAGGDFTNKSGHNFIAEWDGNGWHEPGAKGDPFYTSQPIYNVLSDSAGNTFVSGNFIDNADKFYIEYYNGSGWSELRPPDTSGMRIYSGAPGLKMTIDPTGNLYVTGYYSAANSGYECILKWDGQKWSKLEEYSNSLGTGQITYLTSDKQGNVYVSGSFSESGLIYYSIAEWNGQKWVKFPWSSADFISSFVVSGDRNIYAFGDFMAASEYYVARYNLNTQDGWKEVNNPDSTRFLINGMNLFWNAVVDSKNNLYINGDFTDGNGKRYIPMWDGNNWSEFGVTSKLGDALAVDNADNIFSSASLSSPNDCTVKKWNGSSWVGVGMPLTSQDARPSGNFVSIDPMGNIYSDELSEIAGVGTFIVKYNVKETGPPQIISFTPETGSLGTNVLISGKHFTGANVVRFGGTPASSFTVTGDTTIKATVSYGTTGYVYVQTAAGADSLQKFTFTCDSITKPVPVISTIADSLLMSSKANYYQWYFNNNIINNAINDSLYITKPGFYQVATSPNNLCWLSSLDYPVLLNPAPLSDTLKVWLYPNPSSGNFTVDVKLPQTTSVMAYVTVYNVNGGEVFQTNHLIFWGNEIKIPVSLNTKGTFFVKVYVNGDTREQTIIIM